MGSFFYLDNSFSDVVVGGSSYNIKKLKVLETTSCFNLGLRTDRAKTIGSSDGKDLNDWVLGRIVSKMHWVIFRKIIGA